MLHGLPLLAQQPVSRMTLVAFALNALRTSSARMGAVTTVWA